MIDFHSHIIPKIDDGSSSVEETVKMMEEAKKVGFTKVIATSHYIEEYYEYSDEERTEFLEDLQSHIKDIEIYLGSEIYITPNIVELVKNKQASTMNNSKYVLFELPMNSRTVSTKETIYTLMSNGFIPIIAHPERYSYVQERPEYIEELVEMGALFQANYGSILGMYGKKAEKTVKRLLKDGLIHFLGSDVHMSNQIYPKIPKAIKKIKKIIGQDEFEELAIYNPQKVLDNQEIEIY